MDEMKQSPEAENRRWNVEINGPEINATQK